jgi:hypothetical protein
MTTFYDINEDAEHIEICCALSFIAEGVNIYNWYLRQENNPQGLMFDETNISKDNLYLNLMNSQNDENIFNVLNVTLYKLNIILDRCDNEFNTLAMLFTNFIHHRQKMLHETGDFPPEECFLYIEIEESNHTTVPNLYISIYELEKKYIEIILKNTTESRLTSYNRLNRDNYTSPYFGDAFILIEVLYMNDDIETILNVSNINIKLTYNSTKVEKFECPICYDEQNSNHICVTTNCGHKYCEKCFRGIFNSSARPIICAMCRSPIIEGVESEILEDV